ncbi:MAG: hypothetical protein AB1714_21200 [Acidobacteriota bacterium]
MRLTHFAAFVLFVACLALALPVRAGDAFIVGGLQVHPSEDIDLSDRWMLSGGSDYRLSSTSPVRLGFEIQWAYYSFDTVPKAHFAPFNLLLNVKYKGPGERVRPVAGFGGGLYSGWNWYDEQEGFDIDNNWQRDFGIHLVFGADFGRPDGKGATVQAQAQKVFYGDEVDDTPWQWLILGGFYF